VSVAVGATSGVGDTVTGAGQSGTHFDAYLFGKLYLASPLRPTLLAGPPGTLRRYRPSLGLALGTNVGTGSLFDQITYGLSLGHVFGKVGLIVGGNSIKFSDQKNHPGRKEQPFFALEYSF